MFVDPISAQYLLDQRLRALKNAADWLRRFRIDHKIHKARPRGRHR
jgi:hypothetical protein